MRFSRLRFFIFVLAHVILVVLLLLWFSNPSEQLYPKSADETERIEVHMENKGKPRFWDPAKPTEDFLSVTLKHNRYISSDFQLKETAKPGRSTNANQNRTQSKPNRTSWDVQSTTFEQTTWKPLNENDFSAEPKWKIEEDYILVASSHHTTCPISVKIKAHNVSWLKQRFLHDITVFMDARHFSDREWKRLGHFIPPFGWMKLMYQMVNEVVSALPRVEDQQLLLAQQSGKPPNCITCAVVGNGGILNASRLGKEIDSHDYVFRVNAAVIKGHEEDVGKRTSFYGFTAFTMIASTYMLNRRGFATIPRDEETKYILLTEQERDYEWLKAVQQNKELSNKILHPYRPHPRDDFGKDFDFKKLLVVHPDFSRYLKNRFLRSDNLNGKSWQIYRPSTGAVVLLTALHLCDTVSAYGFMTDDYKEYSDHYYDKTKTEVYFYSNHDFLLEKDLWAQLHEQNIIKLYKGTKSKGRFTQNTLSQPERRRG